MKKITLMLISTFALFFSSNLIEVKADVDTVPCGNALIDYKKGWFTTNCSVKEGKTCLIRCKGTSPPDISVGL